MESEDYGRNHRRMKQCPSFEECSAPKCPLDDGISKRVYLKGEPRCKCWQRTRFEIGKDELPMMGLLPKEYAGYLQLYGSPERIKEGLKAKFAHISLERQASGVE